MGRHWSPGNDDLPASGATPGTYGDDTHVAQVTVDASGRVTAVSDVVITGGGGGGATELDYVAQATDLTVTATSAGTAQTFIDGNAVIFDGATRILLEFWTSGITSSLGGCVVELFDGATDLGRLCQANDPGSVPNKGEVFLTPSAGSHTYHLKAWRTNGGSTAIVVGSSGGVFLPAWYRITTA